MNRFMFLARASLAAFLAFAGSGSAEAQTSSIFDGPSRTPAEMRSIDNPDADQGRRVMMKFAQCVERTSRRGVEEFLAAPGRTPESHRLAGDLASPSCLGSGKMEFAAPLFRGALFEILYKEEFEEAQHTTFEDVPPLALQASTEPSDNERVHLALRQFGDCVVRTSPTASQELIRSEIASSDEVAAFGTLGPAFGNCLPQGTELKFSKAVLRGVIAEALYRLSRAKAGRPFTGTEG